MHYSLLQPTPLTLPSPTPTPNPSPHSQPCSHESPALNITLPGPCPTQTLSLSPWIILSSTLKLLLSAGLWKPSNPPVNYTVIFHRVFDIYIGECMSRLCVYYCCMHCVGRASISFSCSHTFFIFHRGRITKCTEWWDLKVFNPLAVAVSPHTSV